MRTSERGAGAVPPTTGAGAAPHESDTADRLARDDEAWDAFVAEAPLGTFHQQAAWAEAASDRWERSARVVVDTDDGSIGALLLLHRLGPGPWMRAWAPRGPVAWRYTDRTVAAFTGAVRRLASRHRVAQVFADPELPCGHRARGAFEAAGWTRARSVCPTRTRVVDLTRAETLRWHDLRPSTRWAINRARRDGLTATVGGAEILADFGRLYRETAARVGFRRLAAYERAFTAFDRTGAAAIVVARSATGEPLAAVMLFVCGARASELYACSSAAGLRARANSLVKWEAIRWSAARGLAEYDLYGTDWENLAEFKASFGGEERVFDDGLALATDRVWHVVEAAEWARSALRRRS